MRDQPIFFEGSPQCPACIGVVSGRSPSNSAGRGPKARGMDRPRVDPRHTIESWENQRAAGVVTLRQWRRRATSSGFGIAGRYRPSVEFPLERGSHRADSPLRSRLLRRAPVQSRREPRVTEPHENIIGDLRRGAVGRRRTEGAPKTIAPSSPLRKPSRIARPTRIFGGPIRAGSTFPGAPPSRPSVRRTKELCPWTNSRVTPPEPPTPCPNRL